MNNATPTGQQSPYNAFQLVLHRGYQSEREAKDPIHACEGRPDPHGDPIAFAHWRNERGLELGTGQL